MLNDHDQEDRLQDRVGTEKSTGWSVMEDEGRHRRRYGLGATADGIRVCGSRDTRGRYVQGKGEGVVAALDSGMSQGSG